MGAFVVSVCRAFRACELLNLQRGTKGLFDRTPSQVYPLHPPISPPFSSCSDPGEEMGARTSLFEVSEHSPALPSPTLENIQAAYEDKEVAVATELIQQACCVDCSAGMPRIRGVSPPEECC